MMKGSNAESSGAPAAMDAAPGAPNGGALGGGGGGASRGSGGSGRQTQVIIVSTKSDPVTGVAQAQETDLNHVEFGG
jgi:hypothetical protein